jgi:hypothetical protein
MPGFYFCGLFFERKYSKRHFILFFKAQKMQKSQLAQLIQSFSGQEKREILKFLRSPYFNVREDVIQLFDWFCAEKTPDKTKAKAQLSDADPLSDQSLQLRMTYLMRLLEQYLAQKEFDGNVIQQNISVAISLRKRGLLVPFERQKKWVQKSLESQPMRDVEYYASKFRLHWETHQLGSIVEPTNTEHLQAASAAADIVYVAQKLRLICLNAAQQAVYRADFQSSWESEVVQFAEHNFAAEIPVIAIYLHCYRMLRSPEEEQHFQQFKQMLLRSLDLFSPDENRSLFIWAINYCVRRLNLGEKRFFQEVTDLYKPGIEQGILLENDEISPYTYYNIVAAGLQTGDLEWVQFFIFQYKNALKKQYRESAFSFNLARLEYAQKHFDAVLELLQQVNYRDTLVNLAAKTLLLKTWYELDEMETLQSHLDAMRNYIHRKRVLGYHRNNSLNIIKYTDKLLNINWHEKNEVEKLREAILKEEHLTEREWLLEKMG